MSKFNLIEEPWIRVLDDECRLKEVGIKDALLNAHNFVGLSGEIKTQDFAVLRFLLALMYTIFYRYDLDGSEIDLRENKNLIANNWTTMWENGYIPAEPVEKYLEKWQDRFWLFDEAHPFYQSKAVEGKTKKTISSAKMIGTLFESENKKRLFSDRREQGRALSCPEAARWLLHLNCFDDIAAKNPTPKRSWVSQLGLIALKGKNLFETIMLNFCADVDVDKDVFDQCPSWEQDNNNVEFNRLITVPRDQAALLSLMSRRILLCKKDDGDVEDYYLAGGDYFEDLEVFHEQMTLWGAYQEKKNSPYTYKPRRHNPDRRIWQEFGSIVGLNETNSESSRRPGVIDRLSQLREEEILEVANIATAAIIYDYNQLMTLPVIDSVSDSLSLHAQIFENPEWHRMIVKEIKNCDDAAYQVGKLFKEIQFASGRQDKDAKTNLSGELSAKMRFYDSIDEPFRLWLEDLRGDDDLDFEERMIEIEKTLRKIAFSVGDSIVNQAGINAIFGHDKGSSVKAQIWYRGSISKIFSKAGEQE